MFEAAIRTGAPDPDDAARRLGRIREAADMAGLDLDALGGDAVVVATLCCQRAPYLATLLARDGARLARVAADPYLRREKPVEVMLVELEERLEDVDGDDPDDFDRRLRIYRADEMVRLGARELELGTPIEVGAELAHLADVCLHAAIAFHRAALERRHGEARFVADDGSEQRAELVVVGMGKLGGEELNFSSDIDVIYVYSSDSGEVGDLSLHQFFSKLCERVTRSIGEPTEEDAVFKVDLRLRPEGSRGAIANSLPSIERYYESFGRPWERQAWLKARPCAGDAALGEELLATLVPFVYPRSTSPRVVDDVTELNRRIKAELDSSGVDCGFDVKNGVGGIREVEFFVQALQLIHAGRRPMLRSRSTMGALDQLLFAGLITESERRQLALAYRFLRQVEHVLQLDTGRQTQRLPSEERAVELLARRLGLASADELRATLEAHTSAVAEMFATLAGDDTGPPPAALAVVGRDIDRDETVRHLAELGFRDPKRAAELVDRARSRATSPFGPTATGAAARVAPAFLAEIATSPDPDLALGYAVELIARRGSWSSIWGMMDENPRLIRLVASLFGTSEYLSKTFVGQPELLDALLSAGSAHARWEAEDLDEVFDLRLEQIEPDDEESEWNALAELKNAQVLRIGLADIGGELDPEEVCEELSTLAEVVLRRAWGWVVDAVAARHGVPRDGRGEEVPMAVLALGKLGGRELGYASDLDVIFLYGQDGESDGRVPIDNVTYVTKVAQRLMRQLHALHPSGRLYDVDTRLRPSGSKGLLVSTRASWHRYHRDSAALWERQALIKLRPVAGDEGLGEEVATSARRFVYGDDEVRRAPAAIAATIADMRDRIWAEIAAHEPGLDVKAGRGGLIDVEFAAQYLQLVHGPAHPSLRTPSTTVALQAAAEAEVAPPDLCALLVDGYRFLRAIEHRLRIVHDRSEHRLPTDPIELDKLARRAGFPDGPTLTESFQRWSQDVRRAFEQLLGTRR